MVRLRILFRSLGATPLVTAVAVLSLGLGMGANAAIYSIFERTVLRPLPVEEPDGLVNLLSPGPKPGSQSTTLAGDMDAVWSYAMLRDLQEADVPSLSGIAGHRLFGANLAFEGQTNAGAGLFVTGNYFEVLGLVPAAGRLFTGEDDRVPGAHSLVVLSHDYWRKRFDADPAMIGRTLSVNGRPLEVIGVAPEGFDGTVLGARPEVFVPLSQREVLLGWEGFENRLSYWAYLFARLAPGVSMEEAERAINAPYQAIIRDVELPLQVGMSDRTRAEFADKRVVLEPGRRGQSNIHGEAKTPLLMLLGVTGFVLLIAAANLANLLLVRATNRSGEIAVRLAIGARRRQVVGQLLAESFLLAALGGAFGYLVAHGTLRLVTSILPEQLFGFEFTLGPSVWIFLAVLTAVTGLAGLFPALHATSTDLSVALKGQTGRSSSSRSANRFRAVLATAQIALSLALLVAAGLFAKSLYQVSRVDLGLEVENLATFGISPDRNGYEPEQSRALFVRLEEELAALPGVTDAVAARVPLIAGNNWGSSVVVEGFEIGPDTDTHSMFNEVGPGFFRSVGMRLVAGRGFEPLDTDDAAQVAVVNERFAEKFGLGRDAVGKRMRVGGGEELDIEIVGLVANAKYSEVRDEVPPIFFRPYRQNLEIGAIHFYVRTATDPKALLPQFRSLVAKLDPNLPVEHLGTMRVQVEENVFLDRLLGTLSTAFAVIATILAAIGLYGLLAYLVAQRQREIGLRMALGADTTRVRRMIFAQVGRLILPGTVLGLVAAFALGRVGRSLFYEVEGHDPLVFLLALVVLVAVAMLAAALPAARAARVHPMDALRED